MKKISTYFIVITMVISVASFCFAQEAAMPELLEDFMSAFYSKNEQATKEAWIKLNESPETLALVKENYPYHHALYELKGYVYKIDELKEGLEDTVSVASLGRTATIVTGGNRVQDNADVVRGVPNQSKLSNDKIVRSSDNQARLSQDRATNRQIAFRFANQDRQPNQFRPDNRRIR